jgi:uncharacterized protein
MLLVNACRGQSEIHGIGLIAQECIAAGTMIWRFTPGFDLELFEGFVQDLPDAVRRQVLYFASYNQKNHTFWLTSDDERFMNHSDNPNTHPEADVTYACRHIAEGEEITCDYREIGMLGVSFLNTP